MWSRAYGETGDQRAVGVAVDQVGNIVMCGEFLGQVTFGDVPLASLGSQDVFLVKLDGAAKLQWAKRFGDTDDQFAAGVAVDGAGNAILSGDFLNAVDFGGGPLVSAGDSDVFIAALGPKGTPMASSARWLVALVPVVLIVACNTVDPDQCWPNTTGGFGGAGTIPIGGAVSSGDFPTPAHHPLTSSDLPNPCLEPGSACEEKCLTDYESRAVGCAGFADAVQRKACQDDAYMSLSII